jgi:hypothetical protein
VGGEGEGGKGRGMGKRGKRGNEMLKREIAYLYVT